MTVTPTPDPATPDPNQPPQRRPLFPLTGSNVTILVIAIIGLMCSAFAIYIAATNDTPAPENRIVQETRMYELGTQWAQGYQEALNTQNEDQNVLNSLYGACVLYTNSRVVPQYGQSASASWLSGCLDWTRQQQTAIAGNTPTSSSPTN